MLAAPDRISGALFTLFMLVIWPVGLASFGALLAATVPKETRPAGLFSQRGPIGVFEEAPCPVAVPEGLVLGKDFRFGHVTVPAEHARPEGPRIRLAVAVIHGRGEQLASDPLLICTSGPGTSGIEALLPDFAGGQHPVTARRDAVVIELRGLYYSQPNLLSKERCAMEMAMLGENLSAEAMMQRLVASFRETHRRLARQGVEVGVFNNFETAADIAVVMTALGYQKFNVFGNSAGTLIAQHVMRAYPERLRCVILSSPVPLGEPAFQSMIANGIEMFQKVMRRFAADEAFAAAYPNLEGRFLRLLEKLNAEPVTLSITNPATGKTHDVVLNGNRLAQWLFLRMFFNPYFPVEIGKIVAGDYSPLHEQAGGFFPMPTFSYGLGNSIMLTEPVPTGIPAPEIPQAYTVFARAVGAAGYGPEFMRHLSEVWKVKRLGPYAETSLKCEVPTLILCGEFDHVSPPRYAEIIRQRLTNAQVVLFPGIAHSPIDAGVVPITMVLQFLEDPTHRPDTSGLKEFRLRVALE